MALPTYEELTADEKVPTYEELVGEEPPVPSYEELTADEPAQQMTPEVANDLNKKADSLISRMDTALAGIAQRRARLKQMEEADDQASPEVIEQARQATLAGLQLFDITRMPYQLDWSETAAEEIKQRRQKAQDYEVEAFAAVNPNIPHPMDTRFPLAMSQQEKAIYGGYQSLAQKERAAADALEKRLFTEAPQSPGAIGLAREQADRPAAPPSIPAQITRGLFGRAIASQVEPVVESATRSLAPASGGALGAALFMAPGAGPIARFALPLIGGFGGSQIAGGVQEKIEQATETREETAQRHQRLGEFRREHPLASLAGEAAAQTPLMRMSLREIARAFTGDWAAARNIGIGATIGAGSEVIASTSTGQPIEPGRVVGASLLGGLFNTPTALGRRIGLPANEFAAEVPPPQIEYPTTTPDAQQISLTSTPDGGVRPPEVTGENAPLPAAQGGEGVQPSGQGERVAPSAPEQAQPPKVTLTPHKPQTTAPHIVSTAIRTPKGHVTGKEWDSAHATMLQDAIEQGLELTPESFGKNLGYIVQHADGTQSFQERGPSDQIGFEAGQLKDPAERGSLRSENLKAITTPPPEPPTTPPPTAEATTPEPNVTSIKNARVDEERAQRGLPPMDEVVPVSDREVWEQARATEEADPRAADRLIEQLTEKPRSLNSEETMLLLRKRVQLSSDFRKADDAVVAAQEAGDPTVLEAAQADRDAVSDALTKLEQVHGRGGAGTEQGRAFRLRQLFMREDYSLERMTTALRAEQGGAPLSEAQVTKLREQADKIAQTQQGMDQILAAREAAEKAEGSLDPRVQSLADRIIARLDLSAKNAAQSLRSRLGKLGSAPDPLIVLDVAKIAAAKTAKSAIQFAQWSADMIKEFGEKVRPFLKAGWDQREQHIDSEVSTTVGTKRKTRTAAEKEQSAVKARITALANRTAKLKGRTAAQDFSPLRQAPADLSKNPEWVRLKAENDAAKAAFEKARYEVRKAQRSTEQKVRDTVAETWAASRPILASTDISAPGRQGIFFTLPNLLTNPLRLGRQLKAMFRSQFSETKFQQNEASIKSRPNADLYESSGLYLADIDHKPSGREESFKSELAEKIPGVGRVVRGSNRGFSAFLNTTRADAMDEFVKWSGGRENVTPETAQFLASAINDLTGRGNVSSRQAQGALEWLAKYLFSPRLWVSRFNTAILKPIWRDPLNRAISPRARAVVAGQYVKFLGALMALKWLAELNGGKMELNPLDSDFGKLQFGSKRYDVMGGIGNMVTLLARIATQKTKDDKGKTLRIAWQDEKRPEREMGQILFNHLRNKAAPVPGAIYDFIYGRHPDRSKVTPLSMVKQTMVPITISDTIEYFKKNPPLPAIRDTLINALGISVRDYRK